MGTEPAHLLLRQVGAARSIQAGGAVVVVSWDRSREAICWASAIVLVVIQRILATMPASVRRQVIDFPFPSTVFGHSSGRYYEAIELLSLGSVLVLSPGGVVRCSAINDSTVALKVVGHCI